MEPVPDGDHPEIVLDRGHHPAAAAQPPREYSRSFRRVSAWTRTRRSRQFGTAYFHVHVDALRSWRHGPFGALVSALPGSTYHDPHTGAELRSGPIADIRTDKIVSLDVTGSFRELLMFIQDGSLLTKVGDGSGGTFNLRAEPLATRGSDPSRYFSSDVYGDPETPVFEAYVGDPLVVRNLVAGTNEVHTWHLDGHWFRVEPFSLTSPPTSPDAPSV